MKKIATALLLFFVAYSVTRAQQAPRDNRAVRCATVEQDMEFVRQDPSILERRREFNEMVERQEANGQSATRGTVKIIPVVIHVLHDCGAGNISKAQILDGIRVINEDYRRLNADTVNIPAPFKPLLADAQFEFRLAQIDPFGNCTDGIERIESERTNMWEPRDSLKMVSHWPSNKYLNIWLVNSIYDQGGAGGTILGYAQFPDLMSTKPTTDGVVIRHDYWGTIGTAINSNNAGRVATHEIGHWLGLIHIWADDHGGCIQDDACGDTPRQADMTFGCPSFPLTDACSSGPNGIMFMNYMDYTDGVCQNIFTNNQVTRMTNAAGAYRSLIYSNSNLNATGTNGTSPVTCIPKAAACIGEGFYACAGSSVNFTGSAYNADTITYSWDFPGGTPAIASGPTPNITFNTPGTYGFSVIASSSAGSDTTTYNNVVHISGAATIAPIALSTTEDFELASSFPGDGWVVNYDNGLTWDRVTNAGYSGVASLRINNYNIDTNQVDDYITASYSFQYLNSPRMFFRVANAQRTATSNDQLNVWVSQNCGATWTLRKSLAGTTLATAGVIASSFTPASASQWAQQSVIPQAAVHAPNVRFKFENISGHGNNTYIDDINITATSVVGIQETEFEKQGFSVYPNPSSGLVNINYQVATSCDVVLALYDVTGREVRRIVQDRKAPGIYTTHADVSTLSKGMYFLNLQTENSNISTRFVVQ